MEPNDNAVLINYVLQLAEKDNNKQAITIINMLQSIPPYNSPNLTNHMKELISLVLSLITIKDHIWFMIRTIFNENVGWAIPSEKAIQTIYNWVKQKQIKYPSVKLIDIGAGSGIWELLLHDAGLPIETLVAIDLIPDKKTHKFNHTYWPITEVVDTDTYQVAIHDILFIAWGFGTENILEDYINKGGSYVILLGERKGGCTYPGSDYFVGKDKWIIEEVYVTPSCSFYSELLTLNIRDKL